MGHIYSGIAKHEIFFSGHYLEMEFLQVRIIRKGEAKNQYNSALYTELRTHFEPASETEGVDKEAAEIEEDYQPSEQGRPEESVTAGGRTLTSFQALDTKQKLSLQLNKLKQQTNR